MSDDGSVIAFVPAHPAVRQGRRDVVFEARGSGSADAVLPAFSTLPALVAALGPAQPWVAMPLARVRALAGAAGIATVALDPKVSAGAWRWKAEDLTDACRATWTRETKGAR
jgi:hypothetical protein